MLRRPWPIVILALLHWLAPFGNLLGSLMLSPVNLKPFNIVWSNITASSWIVSALLVTVPIIAGTAIYAIKKWSYPVFLTCLVVMIGINVYEHAQYPQDYSLGFLAFVSLLNLSVVSYFLLGTVRAPYFNSQLRWWETAPRYEGKQLAINVSQGDFSMEGRVVDISRSGLLLVAKKKINPDTFGYTIRLTLENLKITLYGEVVRIQEHDGQYAYGFHFAKMGSYQRETLGSMLYQLHHLGHGKRLMPHWKDDFRDWMNTLFSTGKGLVPERPVVSKAGTSPAKNSDDSDFRRAA